MGNKYTIIKQGIQVTITSILLLGFAFLVYFLLFRLFEDNRTTYGFVSFLRVGYGVLWLILCILFYLTHFKDWLKACFLNVGVSVFLISISVQLYDKPFIGLVISLCTYMICLFLLFRFKMKWYHYYALFLSLPFLFIYI